MPLRSPADVGRATEALPRQALAQSAIQVQLCRLINDASLQRHQSGRPGTVDGPINKVLSSEANVALTDLAIGLAGQAALVSEGDPTALDDGRWVDDFLYARALPIAGGTNQIMRNLIAERGLGLPREATG